MSDQFVVDGHKWERIPSTGTWHCLSSDVHVWIAFDLANQVWFVSLLGKEPIELSAAIQSPEDAARVAMALEAIRSAEE